MSEAPSAPLVVAEAPVHVVSDAPAPEAQVETAAETVEAQPSPEEEAQRAKAKERLSQRFSDLTAQREAAKADAERARQEAEYWREQARRAPAQDYTQGGYDDGADDIDARIERAVATRLEREAQAREQMAQQTQLESLRTTLLESGMEGAALLASGGDVPFTEAMFHALTVSEQPAAIADFLGRNPGEADRIARLHPAQQGLELARIETRLASLPRTTSAPPPAPIVGGRAMASDDPRNMSFEQYKQAREAGRL